MITARFTAALALIAAMVAALPPTPVAAHDATAAAPGTELAPSILSGAERKALIDRIAANLAAEYVFPEKVPAIVSRLRAAERAGRYAGLDQKQLAAAWTADMHAVVTDAHLSIDYVDDLLPPENPGAPPSAERLARRDAFFKSINYGVRKAEVLDDGIGYMLIEGFTDVGGAGQAIESAMMFVANANALIIDLRGNHGGAPETVALVASYLVPPNTHVNDIYYRADGTTRQYWSSGIADKRRIRAEVPIYVLTDKRTASGGEELAYDLQQLKRATLVGESTWGGANPSTAHRLGDHLMIAVPMGRAINPITKTNWEGVGVRPDVAVPADQALAKAIELIKAKAATK